MASVLTENIFTDNERRYASFHNFPKHSPMFPSRLANAGFEYTGHEDEVVCSICFIRYKNWQKGADPFRLHARRAPCCTFVKNYKSVISFNRSCVQDFVTHTVCSFSLSPQVHCVRQKSTLVWDHPNIKKIMEMGYSKDIIQQAVDKYRKHTDLNPEPIDLLEYIWKIEDDRNQAMNLSQNDKYPQFSNQAQAQHVSTQSNLQSSNGSTVSYVHIPQSSNGSTALHSIQIPQSSNGSKASQVQGLQDRKRPIFSQIHKNDIHNKDPLTRTDPINSYVALVERSSTCHNIDDDTTFKSLSLTPGLSKCLSSTLQSGTDCQHFCNSSESTNKFSSLEPSPENQKKAVYLQPVKEVKNTEDAASCPWISDTKCQSYSSSPLRQIPYYQLRLTLKIKKRPETL